MNTTNRETTSGATPTVWTEGREADRTEPLTKDTQVAVCVIGAGIAGLTTAYLLARQGKSVIVLEDGAIGSGETSRTTAHLTAALDDRYELIEKLHGEEGARLAAESHTAAISRIEEIAKAEHIDCGFERVDGYLFLGPDDAREDLEKEEAAARRAGLEDVEIVPRAPVDSFDSGPALRFPRQAQLHPLRYLDGLAAAFRKAGGILHTGTHASDLERDKPHRVATSNGPTVTADAVVVATNTPVFNRVAIHTKQSAYRSYVVAFAVPRGSVPPVLLWDTGQGKHRPYPYHYVRIVRGKDVGSADDLLIVGGEDHKTGQADDFQSRWDRLEKWTASRFRVKGEPRHRWSGQIMEPVDSMGFVGPDPGGREGVFVATGDSGNGMTNGTVAGVLLADLVSGRTSEWARLYDPTRKSLKSIGTYARENANVAARYGDWLRTGDAASADEIERGDGAVIVQGVKRLAVHRDGHGQLTVCSAVCPHLGCVVQWNGAEKTWDCPCHGSRFDARGKVLNGPANTDLRKEELD